MFQVIIVMKHLSDKFSFHDKYISVKATDTVNMKYSAKSVVDIDCNTHVQEFNSRRKKEKSSRVYN